MARQQRPVQDRSTVVIISGLVSWFVTALLVSRYDAGPDWFETAYLPHVDALLIGVITGLATAAAALMLLRRRERSR